MEKTIASGNADLVLDIEQFSVTGSQEPEAEILAVGLQLSGSL